MAELGVLLGALTGLVLGLTGAGGSVIAVPLLVLGFGWPVTQAAPVALLAVFVAAAFGTVVAWDAAYVRYRAAALMSLAALPMAPLGMRLAGQVSGDALMLGFCAILVVVAARLLLQARQRPSEASVVRAAVAGDGQSHGGPLCRLDPITRRIAWSCPCALLLAAVGAASGMLSGMFGVGGGFVIVPALRTATPLSIHSAVATSLLAISLTSAATLLVGTAAGHAIDWRAGAPFVIGSLAGMYAGRRLAPRFAGAMLQRLFAVSMLLLAGLMAWRAA